MKILFVATVKSHIGQFHMPFIEELKRRGCEVHAVFRDNSHEKPGLDVSAIDHIYEIPFERSPFQPQNIRAYKMLRKLIEQNGYDAVHCHTPMGGVITRLACRSARKKGTKILYTAHGFHFYRGAPVLNWLLFYPAEKLLAKSTDCLITINHEDYQTAKAKNFHPGRLVQVNGVGVDIAKFHPADREEKLRLREEYGYSATDFLLIYPADFSARKNQTMLLEAIKMLLEQRQNIRLLLPGPSENAAECRQTAKSLGIENHIDFPGYRRDIHRLAAMCDVSVSSSRQEGLPINLIEAMAMGNAIVATDVRGNNDLVTNRQNGFLVPLNDSGQMAQSLLSLYDDPGLIDSFGRENIKRAEKYSVDSVIKEMVQIYKDLNLL